MGGGLTFPGLGGPTHHVCRQRPSVLLQPRTAVPVLFRRLSGRRQEEGGSCSSGVEEDLPWYGESAPVAVFRVGSISTTMSLADKFYLASVGGSIAVVMKY